MTEKSILKDFFEQKCVHTKTIRINDDCLKFLVFFTKNTRYISISKFFKFNIKYLLMNPNVVKDMFGVETYKKFVEEFNLHENDE